MDRDERPPDEVIAWPFNDIRARLMCMENQAFIRRVPDPDHGQDVEIVDRHSGAVIRAMTADELFAWWERLEEYLGLMEAAVDSIMPAQSE